MRLKASPRLAVSPTNLSPLSVYHSLTRDDISLLSVRHSLTRDGDWSRGTQAAAQERTMLGEEMTQDCLHIQGLGAKHKDKWVEKWRDTVVLVCIVFVVARHVFIG